MTLARKRKEFSYDPARRLLEDARNHTRALTFTRTFSTLTEFNTSTLHN